MREKKGAENGIDMARELRSTSNGKNGAMTFTVTDIVKDASNKKVRKQLGKLKVQKCAIIWYDGYKTKNNKIQVLWDEFIAYMNSRSLKK